MPECQAKGCKRDSTILLTYRRFLRVVGGEPSFGDPVGLCFPCYQAAVRADAEEMRRENVAPEAVTV